LPCLCHLELTTQDTKFALVPIPHYVWTSLFECFIKRECAWCHDWKKK
jgi:hypothetical protein